jgi:hypothetical protein
VGVRGAARLVHDKRAEWVWGMLAELEAAGLVILADKGYQGSTYAKIPYRGKNKPESQKQANAAQAKLRSPGERANAHPRIAEPRGKRRMKKVHFLPYDGDGDDVESGQSHLIQSLCNRFQELGFYVPSVFKDKSTSPYAFKVI